MLKTILNMLAGALIAAGVSAAFAVTGLPPVPGFQTPDGTWLLGLAGGQNYSYQYGITAHAGGGQAACQSLTPGAYLYEIDTVASGNDSICIPFGIQGTNISIRNAGAQTFAMYAQPGTNLTTSSTDTINGAANTASYTVAANNNVECFVAKNGNWSCVKGN